ncbi:chromate transporter [Massilibacterium senegalense]|uniref:chromate transporter n=1 Tax=Massilibacterium senegalense TaxID=1632858 RepID=UPI000785D9B3|nr:chromate transporter [Massilibacterium senegalense]
MNQEQQEMKLKVISYDKDQEKIVELEQKRTPFADVGGVVVANVAIFLPSFLFIIGSLPFFNEIRKQPKLQAAFTGINAAVVGLLLAALYDPVWTSSVQTVTHFSFAAVLYGLLAVWKCPPWVVVIIGAVGGYLLF